MLGQCFFKPIYPPDLDGLYFGVGGYLLLCLDIIIN